MWDHDSINCTWIHFAGFTHMTELHLGSLLQRRVLSDTLIARWGVSGGLWGVRKFHSVPFLLGYPSKEDTTIETTVSIKLRCTSSEEHLSWWGCQLMQVLKVVTSVFWQVIHSKTSSSLSDCHMCPWFFRQSEGLKKKKKPPLNTCS